MVFYDKGGTPRCYSDDNEHIYSYDGEPLGYIRGTNVWNYNGRYLGRFYNNWIVDKNGDNVFFTEDAIGGPVKPIRKLAPLKSVKKLRPLKAVREGVPAGLVRSLNWSSQNIHVFFRG